MHIQRRALQAVLPVTTSEDQRYALDHVRVRRGPRGPIVGAANGAVFIEVGCREHVDPLPAEALPDALRPTGTTDPQGPVYLPAEAITALLAAVKPVPRHRWTRYVSARLEGGTQLRLIAADLTRGHGVSIPPLTGAWPAPEEQLARVTARGGAVTVCLALDVLKQVVKAAEAIQLERPRRRPTVTFTVPANNAVAGYVTDALLVHAAGKTLALDGLIMPTSI